VERYEFSFAAWNIPWLSTSSILGDAHAQACLVVLGHGHSRRNLLIEQAKTDPCQSGPPSDEGREE